MQYSLDIRTLAFTSGIISLALCVSMLYIYRSRKTYKGFTQWVTASIINCFGLVFLSLRGYLPNFITIVISNTCIVAATGLVAYGTEIFTGGTRRKWLFILFTLSLFISFLYFTYYLPNIKARIVIISSFMAILYTYCGYIIHRYIPRLLNNQNLFLITVFIVQAVWLVLRVITTIFIEGPIIDFMSASAVQGVTIVVFFEGNIFITIGLIILNFQRVEFDMLAAVKEVKTLRGIIPICSSCKKIRNDEGSWNRIETYIRNHSDAEFSHGICPECMQKLYPEFIEDDEQKSKTGEHPD